MSNTEPRPLAWLCELAQEDGTTRQQIVTEDPDGLRWNDMGDPSPFRVTPLYARAALAQQPAASGEPVAWFCEWFNADGSPEWDQYHDRTDPMPADDEWEDRPPDRVTPLYAAPQPAPAPAAIDYGALVTAAWSQHRYAQGSGACIAFKHGAEWQAAQPAPARVPPGWQPIATAPKDGTSVLLCKAISADGEPIDWSEDLHTAQVFVQVAAWWAGDEAWIVYCSQIAEPRLHFEPTHWMPLPAAPTAQPTRAEVTP